VSAAIRACDGDGLVEVAEEAFSTNSFVVATRSSVKTDAKKRRSFAENTAESTSSINKDEATHADFKEHLLKQKASEFMRVDIMDRNAHHKLSEVAHSGEKMSSTRVGDGGTRAPQVAVKHKHWSSAVATNALVGKDAVGALFDPVNNILGARRPKETHANAEECFANAEMTTNGAAVEDVEDKTAQGRRHNNEQQRGAGLKTLANDEAAVMNVERIVSSELAEGWMQAGNNRWAPIEA
jgi:hypothetical protein